MRQHKLSLGCFIGLKPTSDLDQRINAGGLELDRLLDDLEATPDSITQCQSGLPGEKEIMLGGIDKPNR